MEALRLVQHLMPRAGLWENVQGFAHQDGSATASPMQMVLHELGKLGYVCRDYSVDLADFMQVTRRRTEQSVM